jgi:hypothetical protein
VKSSLSGGIWECRTANLGMDFTIDIICLFILEVSSDTSQTKRRGRLVSIPASYSGDPGSYLKPETSYPE